MKGFDRNKLKKQIVSGGIYIALAAAVVTVTFNGVNNIIGSSDDYEIPEIDFELPKIEITEVPKTIEPDKINSETDELIDETQESIRKNDIILDVNIGEQKDADINLVRDKDIGIAHQSGTSSEGISSDLVSEEMFDVTTIETENELVSGEPDNIEYPTEPDPVSYENYAKPAEGYIDKEFSNNELLYSVTMGDYRTHNGIDITGDPGSTVKAINAGVISDIYFDDFYGFTIKIDHGNGLMAYYMNLSETLPAGISKGVKVSHGQVIGGIGNTAVIESAEVSHLHLSITLNGEYVNPRDILRSNY